MLAVLCVSAALAGEFAVSAGAEASINDPFYNLVGLRVGAEFAPTSAVRLGLSVAAYPTPTHLFWSHLASEMVSEAGASPDISAPTLRATALLSAMPFAVTRGDWSVRSGLNAGFGVVRTVDELDALEADGGSSDDALATEIQIHPQGTFGISGELRHGQLALRWSGEGMTYIETVDGLTLETRSELLSTGEVLFWFR